MYIKANVLLHHIIASLFLISMHPIQSSEFLISMHPIQSSDISAGNSYYAENLNCGTFKIVNKCIINDTVQAESGTVGNSMTARLIYIKKLLDVKNSLKADTLECESFNVGNSCIIQRNVESNNGTVKNSMTAQVIKIEQLLDVGNSLSTDILKCKVFNVKNSCTINATVESEIGKVGNSMEIKKGGKIDKSLIVGNTLTCFQTQIPIFAQLSIIKAKESTFGEVHIKNTSGHSFNFGSSNSVIATKGNTVNIMSISLPDLYSFFCYLINKMKSFFWTVPDNHDQLLNDSSMEEEISTFEDCTVGSIVVNKNNNKKQIIELKNTTVSGDITFANGTCGEVRVFGQTNIRGKVENETYSTNDTVYHTITQNASAPSF